MICSASFALAMTPGCSCETASCCAKARIDGVRTVEAARNWKNSRRFDCMGREATTKAFRQSRSTRRTSGSSCAPCVCARRAPSWLEARSQIELEYPATPRPLERTRDVELADRVSEQVGAERDACRRHAAAAAAEER